MGINLETWFKGCPGTEKEVAFWKKRRLFNEPLSVKYPLIFQLESHKKVLIKEWAVDGENGRELRFSWFRLPTSEAEKAELDSLSTAIMNYDFGLGSDRWTWTLGNSGVYSVSSVRNEVNHTIYSNLGLEFEWNNWSPIKVNFLVWRLIQDKVPTVSALAQRNVFVANSRCKLCEEEYESALHLFGSCHVAIELWDFISKWCRIHPIFILELEDLANIHKRNRGSKRWEKVVSMVTQATIWVIWRSRNDAVFNDKRSNVNRMKEEVKMYGYMWLKSRVKLKCLSWDNWCDFNLLCLDV
ncbi:putative reverse transcriptase zinc-binding domain-containing protein [Helianthus annuus]|nr:putative reverse transcriptase zinc-binding domain-containing protein [Helianthus annuus]